MFSHFRLRITLWYSVLFTVILASAFIASYKIISHQLKHDILKDLGSTAQLVQIATVEAVGDGDGEEHKHDEREGNSNEKANRINYTLLDELSNQNYIIFVFTERELGYASENIKHSGFEFYPFSIPKGKILDFEVNEKHYSLTTVWQSGSTIYIGRDLTEISNLLDRLLKVFMVIFPLGLLLSLLCGILVTNRSLRVIKRITKMTREITTQNLSQRIDPPKGKDEISQLILTLNSMIDRLEKSFAQAKQFSQDAAHEIRTPLTIIRGEIEQLLEEDEISDSTSNTIESILEEIHYLSSISERLLLIHNMDTNNIQYHFKTLNLSSLLEEIYEDILIISSTKNLQIINEIPSGIELSGNKELITRLLWNISENAIKYNKDGGSISISLEDKDGKVVIQIKDTGIGIPERDITKIFNRFYRVDKSRSRELGGSGLGLSICKWIADLHNGEILVDSEENVGSTFKIVLQK